MAITYFVPVLLMSYTYTRIAIRLWGSESIGEATQRQNENIKSKRRVSLMIFNKYHRSRVIFYSLVN